MPRFDTRSGLAALLGVILAGSAAATTLYRWVDAQGVVHYSDAPQPGAQTVTVQPPQTYHAPPVPAAASSSSVASSSDSGATYQCSVTAPAADQSFFSPDAVGITVSVQPALRGGDRLVVTLDGNALPGDGLHFEVPQPDRGSHTVSVVVRSADGKEVCTAAPVMFSVERPSLLSPQSPARAR
jgi:hypothetical protein